MKSANLVSSMLRSGDRRNANGDVSVPLPRREQSPGVRFEAAIWTTFRAAGLMRLSRIGLFVVAGVVAPLAIWGTLRTVEDRRCRALLDEARHEIDEGRFATARTRLDTLLKRRPAWDEARYNLGVCEYAQKHLQAAWDAFERVPSDSPWAGWRDVRLSRIALDRGRFSDCEDLLLRALHRSGPHVAEARWGLVLLLRMQGRFDEARHLLQAGFHQMSSPIVTLQRLYKLDTAAFPTEGMHRALERAGQQAPDDDRVWLAQAHLAIRVGDFAKAKAWLDRCHARRPDDLAVWRMTLEWALGADRPEDVLRTLPHLPANQEPEGRVHALRAWLASRQNDRETERRELKQWVELNPVDGPARQRLADLEWESGHAAEAGALRRAARTIDELRKEYGRLLAADAPESHAAELARLAVQLGRRFDAARWEAVAPAGLPHAQPAAAPTLSDPIPPRDHASGQTLADLLLDFDALKNPGARSEFRPAEPPPVIPRFVDDAATSGLTFVHESGAAHGRLIPPVTASGGVGLLDFDGDGWLDVYLVQGGPFPPIPNPDPNRNRNPNRDPSRNPNPNRNRHPDLDRDPNLASASGSPNANAAPSSRSVDDRDRHVAAAPGDRLYRNRGDGTFEDVTARAGITAFPHGYGMGVAVGDYDNDGRPDLFVTRWRSYALYHNRGDGTFEDATARADLGGDRDWPTSAAFADLDNDGDLDLYVCHYLKWDENDPRSCSDPSDPTIYHCLPLDFEALPDHVFRNDNGRFIDVTGQAGIEDRNGRGLGVLAADLDGDGRVDLFVANDLSANYLFRNKGGFCFEEVAHAAGVAGNATGSYQAGMGVACADVDGDGRLDLAVTNFYNESTTFFRNLGQGFFSDQTAAIGLAIPSRYQLGFGIAFLDANNDGWSDLITANGHVFDGRPQFPWKMPVQLFLNDGHARLMDVSAQAGSPFPTLRLGRALAAGDLDNDGRIDALVVSQDDPIAFFHNQTDGGHFLTLRLEGTTSNRDAVGAVVSVHYGGCIRSAPRLGGASYQSSGDPRLHFGLGTARQADRVEVRWPSGRVDQYSNLPADADYLLREGEPKPRPLPGSNARRIRKSLQKSALPTS
jgi:tetratricopeptide (TPR) repeat protein